ncbi:MAG: SLC13 family permease [Chloroflexota bacterium]|nr:SLC13 family permease [Chloroflexota bacterium]
MTSDMWIVAIILAAAIILFITEWLRVDVVAITVVVALMLTGILTPEDAISGFANPAVLTIASLFVIGGAVLQTGLAGAIGQRILRIAGDKPITLTATIMVAVALLSAIMSDSGTVAVLLPATISLAVSAKISPSKLLIPLSFGALLGGATTLIGTPPNIIVSDLLREVGLTPFQFFDYTPIGLVLLVAGVLFMVFLGRRLLPDRVPAQDVQRVETPEELVDLYRLPDNLFHLRVRRGSNLIEHSLEDTRLRSDFGMLVLNILRPAMPISPARLDEIGLDLSSEEYETISPEPETIFKLGDLIIAQGNPNDMSHAAAYWNLGVLPVQTDSNYDFVTDEIGIAEVILPPRSSLVGKTVVSSQFGTRYKLTVLGINRPGFEDRLDLKETVLHFGDSLLVQGPWHNILNLRKRRRDFVVLGEPEQMVTSATRSRAPIALLILAGMLVLMITNLIPVAAASMLAALLMILAGCLTIDEAYEAVDWKSIVLIAGMLPMSIAMEKVGLVDLVAQGLIDILGPMGPTLVLAGIFILTSLFTQVLSNTTTTVLIAPIALTAANSLGVQPYAFMMGVAVAASMAFATPVASPVNTLVMGAGSYRFSDYAKVGLPMILIMLVLSLLVLPLLWPY